jgi:hypothetical protein
MMAGAEYLGPDMLRALWRETASACGAAWAASGVDLQTFLKGLNPAWNLVGRVHFNLAENRRDADAPFAFMATYTTQLSAQGRAQHAPLGQALRDYAGADNRSRLLTLLLPVQRAAESCAWLRVMVENGEIFHPLRWSAAEASRLLANAAELASAGVVLRMPASWRAGRPARPQVTGVVGARQPSAVGLEGLLDFRMSVSLVARRCPNGRWRRCCREPTRWFCCAASGWRWTARGWNARCGGSARPRCWRHSMG